MNRRQLMSAVSALILTASMSTGVLAQESKPVEGGTLNIGFISDVRTLDPIQSTQWTERQILFLIFDTLVEIEPDFSLKPRLAKSWEFSDGGKKLVLKLQEGVKFHDGSPFNAEAVKWNLDTRRDPDGTSSQKKQLDAIEDVVATDEHTVTITMKMPYPPLLALLADRAGLMVSPAAAKEFGEDLGSNPVGTGPFTLDKWTRGSRIDLQKNPEFWQDGLPHLDAVTFNDIPTNVVGIQRMSVGELDFISQLDPLDARLASASPDIEMVKSKSGLWYSLQWRWDVEPYNNPELRKAVAYGLNRERLNQIVWDSKGTVSNGVTPDGLWWTPSELATYEYDLEKARQIVKDAGLEGTTLTLAAPSGDTLRRISELAKEDLDATGLKVELAPVPQSEYYAKTVAGEIRFTPMRWTQRADPDGLIQYLFASKGGANSSGYNNEQVDSWIEEARVSTDQAARKELYDKIQLQISEDMPYMPIGFSAEFYAMRKAVGGFTPMPDEIPRFRYMWKSQD
ncbi:ABC transporter substrate-binding protein [Aquibium oceanicum]|nr:ABC transporter substrate-binding protein [Aquibium oceanicum]